MYVLLGTSQCMGDQNSCVLHVKAIKATVFGTEFCYFPPTRYITHSGCVFYSPLSGFSLLADEVT